MSVEDTENARINPKAMDLEIGIRSFRTITVYPLSLGDQIKMTDVISQGISEFFLKEGKTDVDLIAFGVSKIQTHLKEILGFVLDESETSEAVIDSIDNDQAVELVTLIYEMNFEGSIKNAMSLFEKIKKNLFQSERPLPQSVNDMDTELEISITDGLKMEATPKDS